jgi:hypothetical protein
MIGSALNNIYFILFVRKGLRSVLAAKAILSLWLVTYSLFNIPREFNWVSTAMLLTTGILWVSFMIHSINVYFGDYDND